MSQSTGHTYQCGHLALHQFGACYGMRLKGSEEHDTRGGCPSTPIIKDTGTWDIVCDQCFDGFVCSHEAATLAGLEERHRAISELNQEWQKSQDYKIAKKTQTLVDEKEAYLRIRLYSLELFRATKSIYSLTT